MLGLLAPLESSILGVSSKPGLRFQTGRIRYALGAPGETHQFVGLDRCDIFFIAWHDLLYLKEQLKSNAGWTWDP